MWLFKFKKFGSSVTVAILQVFSSDHVCPVAAALNSALENIPCHRKLIGSAGRQDTGLTVMAVCSQLSLPLSG